MTSYVVAFPSSELHEDKQDRVRFDSWEDILNCRTDDTNELVFPDINHEMKRIAKGVIKYRDMTIFEFD